MNEIKINLHPLAGMKSLVMLKGDERRFELSDNAKRRQAAAKLAKKNYMMPSVVMAMRIKFYKKMKRKNPNYPFASALEKILMVNP